MKIFRVKDKEYEIYLSINGLTKIEEQIDKPFWDIDLNRLDFRSVRAILYGMLWEKNKFGISDVGILIDNYLLENDLKSLGTIIRDEINLWSNMANKVEDTQEEKKNN